MTCIKWVASSSRHSVTTGTNTLIKFRVVIDDHVCNQATALITDLDVDIGFAGPMSFSRSRSSWILKLRVPPQMTEVSGGLVPPCSARSYIQRVFLAKCLRIFEAVE